MRKPTENPNEKRTNKTKKVRKKTKQKKNQENQEYQFDILTGIDDCSLLKTSSGRTLSA